MEQPGPVLCFIRANPKVGLVIQAVINCPYGNPPRRNSAVFIMADFVKYAASFGLDLSPTDKKMVRKENFYREVKPGQHLAVLIGKDSKNPWHHGIYAGEEDGRGYVYHMTGENKSASRVQKGLFFDFARGRDEIAVVLYTDETDETLGAQLLIAQWCHENFQQEDLYKLSSFNCEHFAVMCKTGRCASCSQIVCIRDMLREIYQSYRYAKIPKHGVDLVFTGAGPPNKSRS